MKNILQIILILAVPEISFLINSYLNNIGYVGAVVILYLISFIILSISFKKLSLKFIIKNITVSMVGVILFIGCIIGSIPYIIEKCDSPYTIINILIILLCLIFRIIISFSFISYFKIFYLDNSNFDSENNIAIFFNILDNMWKYIYYQIFLRKYIGKWKFIDNENIFIEYFKNGYWEIHNKFGVLLSGYNYKISKGKIKDYKMEINYKISRNTITIINYNISLKYDLDKYEDMVLPKGKYIKVLK